MKHIDFSFTGGFPLEQDTLDFMQQAYNDIVKMHYSHLFMDGTGLFILSGAKVLGTSIGSGWLLWNGELLQLGGGSGGYLKIEELTTNATFEDNSIHPVYNNRYAVVTTDPTGAEPVDGFTRVNGHKTISFQDCTHLADRTYECQLPSLVSSLETYDATGNTNGGFILNRIAPFDNIPNGYELIVKLGIGTGLTYMTKNGVESNIRFNIAQRISSAPLLRPLFGNTQFIGSSASGNLDGMGYDRNVHVLLKWSEAEQIWIEINRMSIAPFSNSI